MTQQFDEGVKEILTGLALGASTIPTMIGADKLYHKINSRPEPIEQKIQALDNLEKRAQTGEQREEIRKVKTVIQQQAKEPEKAKEAEKPKDAQPAHKPKNARELYIYNRLREGGISRIGAIGILANFKGEASPAIDPGYFQKGGPGRGIAQWEAGGRFDSDRVNLKAFADARGSTWDDLDTQIDFMFYEFENLGKFKHVPQALNQAKTIEDAMIIFLRDYEKAGKPRINDRIKYAKELNKTLPLT